MQKELFERIHVGDTVEGTVKNVSDFGAFIDLGGADGLERGAADCGAARQRAHLEEVALLGVSPAAVAT